MDNKQLRLPQGKIPFHRLLDNHARLSFEHAVIRSWISKNTYDNAPRYGRLSEDGKEGAWEDPDARAAQRSIPVSSVRLTELTKAAELFENGSESNRDLSDEDAPTNYNSTRGLSKAAERRLRKAEAETRDHQGNRGL